MVQLVTDLPLEASGSVGTLLPLEASGSVGDSPATGS